MRTVYIDSDFKCHIINDGSMTAVETDFFDGKCENFIKGYRFVPQGASWTRSDGKVFYGEMLAPWGDYAKMKAEQQNYELLLLAQYESELAELDAALLEAQYQNIIGGL